MHWIVLKKLFSNSFYTTKNVAFTDGYSSVNHIFSRQIWDVDGWRGSAFSWSEKIYLCLYRRWGRRQNVVAGRRRLTRNCRLTDIIRRQFCRRRCQPWRRRQCVAGGGRIPSKMPMDTFIGNSRFRAECQQINLGVKKMSLKITFWASIFIVFENYFSNNLHCVQKSFFEVIAIFCKLQFVSIGCSRVDKWRTGDRWSNEAEKGGVETSWTDWFGWGASAGGPGRWPSRKGRVEMTRCLIFLFRFIIIKWLD